MLGELALVIRWLWNYAVDKELLRRYPVICKCGENYGGARMKTGC